MGSVLLVFVAALVFAHRVNAEQQLKAHGSCAGIAGAAIALIAESTGIDAETVEIYLEVTAENEARKADEQFKDDMRFLESIIIQGEFYPRPGT